MKEVKSPKKPLLYYYLLVMLVLLLFNLVLLRLSGNTGVAAYGVVANLALVGIAVFTGLCTGIQPLVSRSSGLGDREQLRRLFRWGICTVLPVKLWKEEEQ